MTENSKMDLFLEICDTKIFLGTRVNIRWRSVWYDGTVIKLGPKTDLVKISSVEDGYEYLMEPEQVKQNHSRFGEFQVAYNDGESWVNAVLIDNSVEGAAQVRWRKDIYSKENETWFELDDIAPIVRNEAYHLQDESIQASKSGMLPTRILDEQPRTVENVLYETDDELNHTAADNSKSYESSDNESEDMNQGHLPTLPEEEFYPPMWENVHPQMMAPPIFPPMSIVNKVANNISQASIPCSWSYNAAKPSEGISHHYASSFFMNLRARKVTTNHHFRSSPSRSVKSEEHRHARFRLPSVSVKSDKHQPLNRNSPKTSVIENTGSGKKTGRKHSLFNQFLLRRDSRMETQTSPKPKLGPSRKPREEAVPDLATEEPRVLSASPDIIMARADEHILLTCTAISETPMTYTWQKNDADLVEAPNITTPGEGILQIQNVTAEDAGSYTCTVANSNGSVQKSFRVLIHDHTSTSKRRTSPQRKAKPHSPQNSSSGKNLKIPKTEVQSFLDSILTEMEEFHDSLEDITLPSPKSKTSVPKITITTDSSSTVESGSSTTSTNNQLSGEIEQYLEGYGGDDYGALSSTSIEKSPSKVRTSSKTRNPHKDSSHAEEFNSVDVHTSLGSSNDKISHEDVDKATLELPSDEESVSDQIQRFQLSIQEKDAEALLTKTQPKSPKRWLGGILSKRKRK